MQFTTPYLILIPFFHSFNQCIRRYLSQETSQPRWNFNRTLLASPYPLSITSRWMKNHRKRTYIRREWSEKTLLPCLFRIAEDAYNATLIHAQIKQVHRRVTMRIQWSHHACSPPWTLPYPNYRSRPCPSYGRSSWRAFLECLHLQVAWP